MSTSPFVQNQLKSFSKPPDDKKKKSDLHMKKHIHALKQLVKERDDELFDLRMALDVMGYKKKTKKISNLKQKLSHNLGHTRPTPNNKRTLVLSRVGEV